jgi:hypothetical protein
MSIKPKGNLGLYALPKPFDEHFSEFSHRKRIKSQSKSVRCANLARVGLLKSKFRYPKGAQY